MNAAGNLKSKKDKKIKAKSRRKRNKKEKSSTQPNDTLSSTRFLSELISSSSDLSDSSVHKDNISITSNLMSMAL